MKPGRENCTGKGIEVGWKGCKGGMGSKETGGSYMGDSERP